MKLQRNLKLFPIKYTIYYNIINNNIDKGHPNIGIYEKNQSCQRRINRTVFMHSTATHTDTRNT